jgi:hypothetical protein
MNDDLEAMAKRFFGYGRWKAPYWFIGLEEGKGREEPTSNALRLEAWRGFGMPELCDCRYFHPAIKQFDWHRGDPKPRLQPTWRPLMLLLKTFLQEDSGKDALREYQRERWGNTNEGETCVIELSGQAARNLKEPSDRERFRDHRIEVIKQKLQECCPAPVFVVMYGLGAKEHFRKIAGQSLVCDDVVNIGSTLFALAPQPAAFGRKNEDWIRLGKKLRESNDKRKELRACNPV